VTPKKADQAALDEKASQLIDEVVNRLRRLGGGTVPDKWQTQIAQRLASLPLNIFISQYLKPKRRGRPVSRTTRDDAELFEVVAEIKSELDGSSKRSITDRDAFRYLVQELAVTASRKEKLVDSYAKRYSRIKSPTQRRPKRKSHK
jgi:hypothetical protein